MKRNHQHVAITAAAALIVWTAASAQEGAGNRQQADQQRSAWQDSLAYDEYLGGQALRASELIGARVQNEQGESLGEVRDLVVSRQDDVIEAVIAVGGVLGIGEKTIGVPYERLRVSSDGETLFLSMTREQLEAQPEWQEPERGQAAVGRTAPAGALSQADRQAQSQADQQQRQLAQQRDQAEQARLAEQRQREEAQLAQRQQQAPQAGQPPRQAEPPSSEQVVVMDSTDRRATELIGMTVIDSRGEQVGEIDDLVVSPADGTIQAVLAVGGVLGIGQKLVSVPLDQLEITPQGDRGAAGAPGGEQDREDTVRIDMTSEELLRSQPEFQYGDQERTANVR